MSEFKTSKLSRLTKITASIAKASSQIALNYAVDKTNELKNSFQENREQVQDLTYKIKATKEIIQTMGQMKGALMKLGQMISITEDMFLPKEITDLFKELQRNAPPMSEANIRKVFYQNFGKNPEDVFKEFNYHALASASIGQVHLATLSTGEKVAVKIQYPEIVKAIKNDFQNIHHLNRLIEVLYPKKPNLDEILVELKTSLLNECDYEYEYKELLKFRELYQENFPQVKIPAVYKEYCTKEILTMEYMEGVHFDETLTYPQAVKNHLGQMLYDNFQYSLWQAKRLHTDPQNGNFLFNHENIILLDFGSTREFSDDFLVDYCTLLLAVENSDFELYKIACYRLRLFSNIDQESMIKTHYEMVLKIYEPYLAPGKYAVTDLNPIKHLKEFMDQFEFGGRESPRREFLLLDRTNLGLFTKLKFWGAEVDWLAGKNMYRNEMNAKVKALYPSHFSEN
ncbi:MAG: AarF/ABC1/UbiB kinase family protein [Bacteriovoracaceae bacterium]|nr:AarF/ABC1/UbiB kinase family protein [Bacteriovoracaceae bacterium]